MADHLYICGDCPRNCNAQRTFYTSAGFCKAGLLPVINRTAPHFWEEPCISGKNGSGTVFFGGCNLRCVYCQNSEISRSPKGKIYSVTELADKIKYLELTGVHNINLVTPTHYTYAIVEALKKYKPSVPVVYNCGGYESVKTLKRLEDFVDIYLTDFKYITSASAKRYSKAPDYPETVKAALKEMVDQTGAPVFDNYGMLQKGVIVRHLVLPSNTDESISIIDYLDREYGNKILFSLMHQYYPAGDAEEYPEINRRLTKHEYQKVLNRLLESSLDGFVQDSDSAKATYTPNFDTDSN